MIDTLRLDAVFCSCLYKEEEIANISTGQVPEGCVHVDGIVNRFGLHPERLEAARTKVVYWLRQLPDEFRADRGGGWSFLNACMTGNGDQWGEHRNVEQLICLGLGLKLVECQLPRELWKSLPGGMPYYVIVAGIDTMVCATDEEIAAIQLPERLKEIDQPIAE